MSVSCLSSSVSGKRTRCPKNQESIFDLFLHPSAYSSHSFRRVRFLESFRFWLRRAQKLMRPKLQGERLGPIHTPRKRCRPKIGSRRHDECGASGGGASGARFDSNNSDRFRVIRPFDEFRAGQSSRSIRGRRPIATANLWKN